MTTLVPCPACGLPHNPALIPPPRVPPTIRCACCCQDGRGNLAPGLRRVFSTQLGWWTVVDRPDDDPTPNQMAY